MPILLANLAQINVAKYTYMYINKAFSSISIYIQNLIPTLTALLEYYIVSFN